MKGQLSARNAHIPFFTHRFYKWRLLNGHQLHPPDLMRYTRTQYPPSLHFSRRQDVNMHSVSLPPPPSGWEQFRYKPVFTSPSTLRHRKPITTDASLATTSEKETCVCCLCVVVSPARAYMGASSQVMHGSHLVFFFFPRTREITVSQTQKMSNSIFLDVCFFVCAQRNVEKDFRLLVSQETLHGP